MHLNRCTDKTWRAIVNVETNDGEGNPEDASGDEGKIVRDSSRVEKDFAKCEQLISLGASAGIELAAGDLQAIQNVQSQLRAGRLTVAAQAEFYCAMARIVSVVPYPSQRVSNDVQLCSEVVSHAARTGKTLDKSDLEAFTQARAAQRTLEWHHGVETRFYDSMARISKSVAPVAAETASSEARQGARIAIRNYSIAALVLTFAVLLVSCLMFIIKQISDDISEVIKRNDPLAVSMHNQLQIYAAAIDKANETATVDALVQMQNSPDAVVIKESLQTFATNNRQLFSDVTRTRAITHFIFRIPNGVGRLLLGKHWGEDWGGVDSRYGENCPASEVPVQTAGLPVQMVERPVRAVGVQFVSPTYGFALPPSGGWQCSAVSIRHALEIDLPIFALGETANKKKMIPQDAINHGFQKIAVSQDVRAMATYARDIILVTVASVTGFILPILYAWLGACASILRRLRADTTASLFHPEYSKVDNRSHVTTAVIVGISIGLFSNLLQAGTDISPLAIAFIAGYASDKFFEFIDRLVHAIFPSHVEPGETRVSLAPGTGSSVLRSGSPFRRRRLR